MMGLVSELARTRVGVAALPALPAGARVAAHTHDLPYLSVHILGGYRERGEEFETLIDGPAAAFHPAGAAHEDAIGGYGSWALLVRFDPAWLTRQVGPGRLPRARPIGLAVSRRHGRAGWPARPWSTRRPISSPPARPCWPTWSPPHGRRASRPGWRASMA